MPKFSQSSKDRLAQCEPELQRLFNEVIKEYDCIILEGFRDKETQNEYYRTGKSKIQWPNGKHNVQPSMAIDVSFYPIEWTNWNSWFHFVGYVLGVASALGIKIRSGLDWDGDRNFEDQSFIDAVHFELVRF